METKTKRKKQSQLKEIWRRLKKNQSAMLGLGVLTVFLFLAVFAGVISPYANALEQSGADRLQPPSAAHLFGTDAFGRDVFTRILHGSRISLTIGLATTAISLVVGGFLGALAGYYGGTLDSAIMRLMDVVMSIPAILLALAIVATLGPGMTNLLIAITVAYIPAYVRIVRASILTVVDQEFVEAARAYAASDFEIIFGYILPNAIGPIIVQATLNIASVILAAAALSFIGMGVQPPTPEWGAMLSDSRAYIRTAPYLLFFPGLAIVLAALSLNLIGDGLRDALDPRLKT